MNTHSFHHRIFRGAVQAVPSFGVFLLTVLLVVQSGITQQRMEPPSPAMEVDRIARAMSRAEVGLSTDQQKKIFSVYVDAQTAAQSSSSSSTDEFARRQQMEALQASVRKEVRALLTEAQQKVFDTMATQRGAGSPPSGPPPSGSQN
ncbi:hypothetical protein [Terriglobus sp. RCC_193]|uniref:hypothetical protein n=1 Tax=Terriglobus sp. RCC_193 TaxID=3239218 RepID=UPI003524ED8B